MAMLTRSFRRKLKEAGATCDYQVSVIPRSGVSSNLRAKNYDEAEKHLRTAVELEPKFMPAYRHLAELLFAQDKPEEALKLLDKFHELLTTDSPVSQDLGKLVVFCGVRDYPARVKCATLAWHTLKSALTSPGDTVSTE